MKYFVRQVLPVFHAAHCVVDVIVTQHRNHAWDDIRDLTTLSHYDGIVAVSGDGLVNELVNGLMHRPSQSLAGLRQIKYITHTHTHF
jgi:sphingosine kinase